MIKEKDRIKFEKSLLELYPSLSETDSKLIIKKLIIFRSAMITNIDKLE